MTSPIIDFTEIDLTGSVKFEDQQIGSVYYNGERLWPFGVDLLYTGGIGGASYLPDLDRAFSSFYADAPGSFGGSIAALEATNDRDPLSYSDIFLAGNEGDAFVVAPAYCFTDLAGSVQAGEGDVVLAMRGVVKGTLITQSDPASQPVLEKDARGVWSLRCNGNKFLRSSELFTVAANFTATVAMSVLSLTGLTNTYHVFGPVIGTTTASLRVRASGSGGASTVSSVLRIAGGTQFSTSVVSAFNVGVPFVATGMHEGSTITARQGDLLFSSAAANAGTGTAQANLQLGVSGGHDARFYGGVYINRALSQTERMRIEKRMKLDFGIRPDGAIASGQPSASLCPLLGRAPKERRNLLTRTEEFEGPAWTKTNVSFSGFTATASSTAHLIAQDIAVVPGQTYTFSFYAQRGTMTDARYSVFNVSGVSNIIAPTSYYSQINDNNLTRVSFSFTTPVGCTSVRVYPLRDSGVTGTVVIGGIGFGAQLELGSTATPYQRVGAATDITEEGVPSYPFVRFDLSDDRLDTVLPQAVTGDVVIAGRNGSVIAPHSYAAGSTFQLGPTSYTGGTPGILRAIGDVVGWSILDKTLTAAERERLMRFYKRRGAKGLLVPGPELVVNGTFDTNTAGWAGDRALVSFDARGAIRVESTTTFNGDARQTSIPTKIGATYRVTFDVVEAALGGGGISRVGLWASAADVSVYGFVDIPRTVTTRTTYTFVAVATSASSTFRLGIGSNTGFAVFDNVSVRELRPEEEW